jgi:hypothetical protein
VRQSFISEAGMPIRQSAPLTASEISRKLKPDPITEASTPFSAKARLRSSATLFGAPDDSITAADLPLPETSLMPVRKKSIVRAKSPSVKNILLGFPVVPEVRTVVTRDTARDGTHRKSSGFETVSSGYVKGNSSMSENDERLDSSIPDKRLE